MPKWLRALIAAYGAKKLGGGCLSTILIFVVIYYALGKCNRSAENSPQPVRPRTTYHQPKFHPAYAKATADEALFAKLAQAQKLQRRSLEDEVVMFTSSKVNVAD